MAYLVTGATGFIGRFLVDHLLERDDRKVWNRVTLTSLALVPSFELLVYPVHDLSLCVELGPLTLRPLIRREPLTDHLVDDSPITFELLRLRSKLIVGRLELHARMLFARRGRRGVEKVLSMA